METLQDHWTTGNVRPISLDLKSDGELIQLDFEISQTHVSRFVMDKTEFKSFVKYLLRFDERLPYEKLPPGELDPRD